MEISNFFDFNKLSKKHKNFDILPPFLFKCHFGILAPN